MNIEYYIKNWTKLRTIIAKVPTKEFKMDSWAERTKCGTKACMGGHAAMDPYFKAQGLEIDWSDDEGEAIGDINEYDLEDIFGTKEPFLDTGKIRSKQGALKVIDEMIAGLKAIRVGVKNKYVRDVMQNHSDD